MTHSDEVLFHEQPGSHGDLGIITLNRPAALNALNLSMIRALSTKLTAWSKASHIKAVIIKAAEGKAFCAGGDIKSVFDGKKNNRSDIHLFFHEEYQLNKFIFHFPKPYIALLNGITMGGGVGISIHGSHRVATENTLFAMPETGIGFFPDVGGTYFLPRLVKHTGYYLGLTGARIKAADCVALGLAQHKMFANQQQDLIAMLAETNFNDDANKSVTKVINHFSLDSETSHLITEQAIINQCFAHDSIEDIIKNLHSTNHKFCQLAVEQLCKKSPLSLKVTLKALQLGQKLAFDDCIAQEYQLALHFLQGHDFMEGIRALLIDKDNQPIWQPAHLNQITEQQIDQYFTPIK